MSKEITTELISSIITQRLGQTSSGFKRFTTGVGNYVFEVFLENAPSVVLRISGENNNSEGSISLLKKLHSLGIRVPRVLGDGEESGFSYLILERLSGVDLAYCIDDLNDPQLLRVAESVVESQKIVATLPSSGKYGFAVDSDRAPFSKWSHVVGENIERSRSRILSAQIFDEKVVDGIMDRFCDLQERLDVLPAIPFLHDTTTKNVIVDEKGEFQGIVDVDDLCFGDPHYVVALTEASILAFGGNKKYTQYWMDAAEFKRDTIFDFYVATFILDFMGEQGQIFNGNQRKPEVEMCSYLNQLLERYVLEGKI